MEDVLDIYESEYNKKNPVVCVDEKPYQLLDHKLEHVAIKKGTSRKNQLLV